MDSERTIVKRMRIGKINTKHYKLNETKGSHGLLNNNLEY